MLSPYQKEFEDYTGKFTLDVFITKENKKESQRLNFTEEEFEQIVELLTDLFPPKEEGDLFNFNIDGDTDYLIKPINECPN